MIKIGDFSNLAHISIKALHHYDELGLLKPAHIDRFSGYRYYSIQQLAVLNRILALKDLGLSLEQVAQLLREEISPAEMRGMLRLKQIELTQKMLEEQAQLARVEQRLQQLEQENIPHAEIAIKQVPAQMILTAQIVAAREEMIPAARQSLQTMLQNALEQAQLKAAGPWFALMDNLPYVETDREITLAIAVNLRKGQRSGDWGGSPVRLQVLPAEPAMASVIHTNAAAPLPQTYTSLYTWTQSNGYRVSGAFREIYLNETPSAQAAWIELQCPVERASIPLSIQPKKEQPMQPEIVTKPAFKTVGYSYIGKNQNGEVPQMWDRFLPHIDEPQRIHPTLAYGLCIMDNQDAKEGEFEYVAGVEVADDQAIPAGMVYREVLAHKYAVFTHHGKLDTLRETFDYIFTTGLAQAGLQAHPSGFDMEVYTDEFHGSDSPDSKMYIYVSLQ